MFSFDLTPEQEQLRNTARRFAEQEMVPVAAHYDEQETFPHDVCRKAWELGLMNVEVPHEYGGLGLGVLDTCILREQLNWGCAGITNALAANGDRVELCQGVRRRPHHAHHDQRRVDLRRLRLHEESIRSRSSCATPSYYRPTRARRRSNGW